MKRLLFGTMLLALVFVVPISTMAAVDIRIGIPLPPPIAFPAPPQVVVIPETNVYVDPDVDVDLYFWNGWWWRLWEGRWYRSRFYNRGWAYYDAVPNFYFNVDPGWRRHYREHIWYGHRWNYERIPYNRLERNWKAWQDKRYWEKRETHWGVEGYKPRSVQQREELKQQWQRDYHQRPEVQQHQQWREQQRQKEHKGGPEDKGKGRHND